MCSANPGSVLNELRERKPDSRTDQPDLVKGGSSEAKDRESYRFWSVSKKVESIGRDQ